MDKKCDFFNKNKRAVFISMAILVIFIIVIFTYFMYTKLYKSPENRDAGQFPYHIERNGKTYYYRGDLVYELPEGYEYTGKAYDDEANRGDVYEKTDCPDNIYFLMEGWDIYRDGAQQPYLLFEVIKE